MDDPCAPDAVVGGLGVGPVVYAGQRSWRVGGDADYDQALAGLAAAILDTRFRGMALPEGAADWSLSLLCDVATVPRTLEYASEYGVYPDGADRKAALGLHSPIERSVIWVNHWSFSEVESEIDIRDFCYYRLSDGPSTDY